MKRSGPEIFKPGTKELRPEYWLRLKMGMSALKGDKEMAVSGKQKGTVYKGKYLQLPPR